MQSNVISVFTNESNNLSRNAAKKCTISTEWRSVNKCQRFFLSICVRLAFYTETITDDVVEWVFSVGRASLHTHDALQTDTAQQFRLK